MEGSVRAARHAGSWYQKIKENLSRELEQYLGAAEISVPNISAVKAIIAPHAGYAYSGPTAGWAYRYLQLQLKEKVPPKTIFLIGPSHKKYFQGCSLSGLSELETPLGNLKINTETIKELREKTNFVKLTKKEQENQHSLEMHMPFIYKVFGSNVNIVPIIVGETNLKSADEYGKLFAPYFQRQDTIFIISSDFCHWGDNFDYQPMEEGVPIWQTVQKMDKDGMGLIEKNDIQGFDAYINKTGNTICGEHPIRVLMNTIKHSKLGCKTQFVKYAQSEQAKTQYDNSVSYASSVTFLTLS